MKRLVHVLIVLLIVAGLGWTVWRGVTHREQHGEEAEAAEHEEKKGDGEKKEEERDELKVELSKEKQEALGLKVEAPKETEMTPRRRAFARVLDPTPLLTLEEELASAETALKASRAEFERTQKLLAAGESASRKTAETAEAQYRADEIKVTGIKRRSRMEWGEELAQLQPEARRTFTEQLSNLEAALVQIDLLPGDALTKAPQSAELVALGREEQPLKAASVSAATQVDAKTQAQAFIARVEKPPFPLRPGMALTAWLSVSDEAEKGFAVPRAAVLRHDGRTWVYVQEEATEFVRKPIELEAPVEAGWFVKEGVEADDKIVVQGAAVLLSEELKAAGGEKEE